MDFKQMTYQIQDMFLSPYAKKDCESAGRERFEPPCLLRTDFRRDRDRIIHSNSFRRLKHKTQVFLSPEGDHYRTRLTHTLEVSQIAGTVARCLRLNEDLTEAVALGHDLGHTPYGHAGERALSDRANFLHNEQSLRVVTVLEKNGEGMNLTAEVKDGILHHTGSGRSSTLEGRVVALCDRIAYINHDIDDAMHAGVLKGEDIPKKYRDYFGEQKSKRISKMILDIIGFSVDKSDVGFSPECATMVDGLRAFLFENVYFAGECKKEADKATEMIAYLFDYFRKDLNRLPDFYRDENAADEQKVCDYISSMSDRFAARTFEEITVPKSWSVL